MPTPQLSVDSRSSCDTAPTRRTTSKIGAGTQVLRSIVMFSLVYLLLFVVWVYVLNSKIHHGPDEHDLAPPTTTSAGGLMEAATANKPAGGESLTQTRSDAPVKEGV